MYLNLCLENRAHTHTHSHRIVTVDDDGSPSTVSCWEVSEKKHISRVCVPCVMSQSITLGPPGEAD